MTTTTASGGAWLIEDASRHGLHARAADRRAPADRPDGRGVRRQRGAAGRSSGSSRRTGRWRASWSSAAASSACSAPTCPRRYGGVELDKVVVARRRRSGRRAARRSPRPSARRRAWRSCRSSASAPRRRSRSTCRGCVAARWSAPTALSESGLGIGRARRQGPRRCGRPTAASCSTARRCGSPTAASPTSSSSSPRSTASTFTAFIVERAFPGVSSGKEEHKMGLHGSSTTPLILQDAQGAGRERARRDRQGPQGRVQRPELRPLQARRDVQRRRAARDRRGGGATPRSASSSASRSPRFGAIQHKLGEMIVRAVRRREPCSIAPPA